ncbi:MAG: polyprenyl synthetase family protein [Bacillota bacterium]
MNCGAGGDVLGYVRSRASLVERRLGELIPAGEGNGAAPAVLADAMRYSALGGGKRLRPVMCVAAGEAVGAGVEEMAAVLDVACAIEMIHTYSLIHDDLPCMDDDDYRRGKPTSHRVFGEGVAVLAGDALLTLAFEVMARAGSRAGDAGAHRGMLRDRLLYAIAEVAGAAGPLGMVGGQALDIELTGKAACPASIERMDQLKTACLFCGAVAAGAIVAGAADPDLNSLKAFAMEFGLGFQIADDVADAAGEEGAGKASYVRAAGIGEARRMALTALDRAVLHLDGLGERAWVFRGIAGLVAAKVREGATEG